MGNLFAANEVVEMGIQIEKNGRDFYNTLLKQSRSDKAKKIFEFLAQEEEKHIIVFQKLLDSIHKYEPAESYPGEYFSYLNTLASEYIFTQKDKGSGIARKTKSDEEAVKLGIKFEKDSILFYQAMKDVVHKSGHNPIDELIRQEKSHLQKLSELKSTL